MTDENSDAVATYGLVPRESRSLLDLPWRYRWEFTRRHPYYQLFWRAAHEYRSGKTRVGTLESDFGKIAVDLLGLIGVTGEPADPAIEFSQFVQDADVDPAFLSGSVQPMTLRNMLGLIITSLPREELIVLRALIDVATLDEYKVQGDEDQSIQKRKAHSFLASLKSPRLDSYHDMPLYYIHLEASQRRIREDIEKYVRRWKDRRGIKERRVHINEFKEYLQTWDSREGWSGSTYRSHDEQSFTAIAEESKRPKSTVVNAYRSAFRCIIGHEFTAEMWFRVMGAFRLATLNNTPDRALADRYRRLMSSGAPVPVPETSLLREEIKHGNVGIVERMSAVDAGQLDIDFEIDLKELLEKGKTDEEIAQTLELSSTATVTYFRQRLAELHEDV